MFSQLENLKGKFIEVGKMISDPSVIADNKRYTALNKEYRELEKITTVYDKYTNILSNIASNKQILETENDEEFRDLAKADLVELENEKVRLEDELKMLIVPKEPEDERNVLLEI